MEPTSDDTQEMKEETIFVEVPPDAVSTSDNVEMHYAIILSGPFTLPKGYQFGSPIKVCAKLQCLDLLQYTVMLELCMLCLCLYANTTHAQKVSVHVYK